MTDLCRICLRSFQTELEVLNSKNMFNHFLEELSYSQIYEYCIGHSIKSDESHLPINLCESCEKNLLNSYTFKFQCLKTEDFLKDLKENITSNSNEVSEKLTQPAGVLGDNEEDLDQVEEMKNEKQTPVKVTTSNIMEEDPDKIPDLENEEATISHNDKVYYSHKTKSSKLKKRRRKGTDSSSVCPICGREFKGKTLKTHLSTHDDQPVERSAFVCDVCGKSFRYKGGLTVHKKAAHIKEKTYDCPYCNEKFDAQYKRRYHVLKCHCDYKFQCKICQHSCITAGILKKHMRTHTGEAPPRNFKCSFEACDRAFECPAKLRIHMSATHLGERIFKCDLCDKTYVDPKSLKYHRQSIHIGEKNYICPLCPAAYFKNLILRSHITKIHPEYELPPLGTSLAVKK